MDSLVSNPSTGSEPDHEELQQHVGFFRKLGYSTPQVKAALTKLGLNSDTNSVLGELVQTSTPHESSGNVAKKSSVRYEEVPPQNPLRPSTQDSKTADLRPVVIDGSNVAMSHGNKEIFSCRGIRLAVNFFLERGHRRISVFVPTWRTEPPRPDAPICDQHILMELEKQKMLFFTPSRHVGGKRVVCYDDRFIVKLAHESGGVIVSNDTYRDLQGERPEWKKCIEERLLMFTFVNDKFMPPDDPLGRHGPSLDNFLRKKPLPTEQKKPLCPYGKKCTYGLKCKFFHPERVNLSYVSLADELREKAHISTAGEAKKPYLTHKQSHSLNETVPQQSNKYTWSSLPVQAGESSLLRWDDPGENPKRCSVAVNQAWVPHEYLDSGLGSYESASMAFNYFPESQPNRTFPTTSWNRQSLSSQHNKAPGHQQNYQSNPSQGRPEGTSSSSRSSLQASEVCDFCCSTDDQPFPSWTQQPRDPQRTELSQKLYAIFNPRQVDAAMKIFPHLTDAEKLAAEILNMKAQGSFY